MSDEQRDIVIRVRNLSKRFNGQPVLENVSFDVYRGETLVIMGPSGCGKSTLLNCIIAELPVDRGEVTFAIKGAAKPVDVTKADEATLSAIRKRFGILFQSGALFNSMTLAQNVALPLMAHSDVAPDIINIVVNIKLQQVQMLPHRDKMPSELSGGQKKRAGLARATALDPEILFYDEPSAGLDPVTSAEIDQLIIDLNHKLGVTSVVVTHEMDSAFRIADRMVLLDRGKFIISGTPRELHDSTDPLVRQFVHGLTEGPLTDRRRAGGYEIDLLGG